MCDWVVLCNNVVVGDGIMWGGVVGCCVWLLYCFLLFVERVECLLKCLFVWYLLKFCCCMCVVRVVVCVVLCC